MKYPREEMEDDMKEDPEKDTEEDLKLKYWQKTQKT